MSIETDAINYLTSKESYIMPTQFERLAAQLKHSIKMNRVTGLTFPEPKKRKKRVFKTPAQQKEMVLAVNKLRDGGMKNNEAHESIGISRKSYEMWSKKFGILYKQLKVNRWPHDAKIARMVNDENKTIEDACSAFGINSEAWIYRALRDGLYVTRNPNKPQSYYAERVAKVKKTVKDTGSTIQAACDSIGFPYWSYNRWKSLV